jgi:hypothetical protein
LQKKLGYNGTLDGAKEHSFSDDVGDEAEDDNMHDEQPLPFLADQLDNNSNNEREGDDANNGFETMLNDWLECERRATGFAPFDARERHAIELLSILRETKASLDTYEKMMTWHFRSTGDIHPHEKATSFVHHVSREQLLQRLKKRYNRDKGFGIIKTIVLPSSKVRAKLVLNDAQKIVQSLLTRPEISAKDYLFHGNNPFSGPPEGLDYISDLNTGKSYYQTWHDLITDPANQILLPIIMYMDGAQTAQWSNLELTPVKIALGIFSRLARKKGQFWGTLGYIPAITKEKSRGRRALVDSGHADTTMEFHQLMRDEGCISSDMKNACPAQDLHTMLDVVLEGFVKMQKRGFKWDLFYNGTLHEELEFKPFVMFVRADMQEADKLCGAYICRSLKVSQLCQKCETPAGESNDHLANYPAKTVSKIARLVRQKDLIALKQLSQQPLENAFYNLQFGTHNDQGIHGACPLDMLHAILLGIFKHIRVFFVALGKQAPQQQILMLFAWHLGSC